MLSLPAFYQNFKVDFTKNVDVNETVDVTKFYKSFALVIGNAGHANADAKAFGADTIAQTLTLTSAIQGYSSTAFSESLSATNGAKAYVW